MTRVRITGCIVALLASLTLPYFLVSPARADDWPEMQGKGRTNAWNETGILRQFPATGLKVDWRTPVGGGYSGAAVASGRVYVSDYQKAPTGGTERVLCLDEKSGKVLWTYENPQVAYAKFAYNSGPRATPTVAGDSVYVLGGAGDLYCLKVADGSPRWKVNLPTRYQANIPTWGYAGAPLVYGDLVISPAGGKDNATLVALNKLTGEEVWHALPPTSDIGYAPPVIIKAGGVEQLVFWYPGSIASLEPKTGKVNWQQPFDTGMTCATPVTDGKELLVSSFWNGCMMLKLAAKPLAAQLVWQGKSKSEVNTEDLHALMCTPILKDGYIYGIDSYGQLRGLKADTGERVWESIEAVGEKARWANAFITPNRDVYFINNDRGELIIANLTPQGYHELSRTQLIKPTSGGAGSRQAGKVNWTIPAYANRHIIIRNDEEIIRASLAK